MIAYDVGELELLTVKARRFVLDWADHRQRVMLTCTEGSLEARRLSWDLVAHLDRDSPARSSCPCCG